MDAWQRLNLMGEIPPLEPFLPSKAQDGAYTKLLKEVLKRRLPTDGDHSFIQGTIPTVGATLQTLQSHAADLIASETPLQHRLTHLRVKARELKLPVRDEELLRLLAEAKRQNAGMAEGLGNRPLSFAPVPWLAEGLLMEGCLNLVIGVPKVGKSSFVIGLIGAWAAGATSYLEVPLIGSCPPVLIVGPDQPEKIWARLLDGCGLLDSEHRLRPPVVDLFTAGQPLQLNDEGIERIAAYAAKNQRLLVVFDTLAAGTRSLAISENDAEIAAPLMALQEALDQHNATVIVVHHAGKSNAAGSPSMASRGSSAIPAIASQTVSLSWFRESQPGGLPDRRVLVKTEGRGGSPIELLIERTDAGWISHGDSQAAQAERRRVQEEARLTDRLADALAAVRHRWETDHLPMEAQTLVELLGLEGDAIRKARAALDVLAQRKLLVSEIQTTSNGRKKVYWPAGVDRSPRGGVSSDPSQPSEPSYPPADADRQIREELSGGRDRRERMDGRDRNTQDLSPTVTLLPSSGRHPEQTILPL